MVFCYSDIPKFKLDTNWICSKSDLGWQSEQSLTIHVWSFQTLICDVHAMTSDHHRWTQVSHALEQLHQLLYESDFAG